MSISVARARDELLSSSAAVQMAAMEQEAAAAAAATKAAVDDGSVSSVAGRFGASLMSKMGWTEGEGLGKSGSGRTVPVQARANIENRGLGWDQQ